MSELRTARDLLTHGDVVRRMEQLREEISQSITASGKRASGRTQESMYVDFEGNKVGLYTSAMWFPTLEQGASYWDGRTGIKCSFAEFKEIIRTWATAKGLAFKDDDKVLGAIAWTIIKHGTKDFRNGGRTDIYTPYIEAAIEDLSDTLKVLVAEQVSETLAKITNKL